MKRFLIAATACAAFAGASPLSAQRALGFRAGASIADLSIDVSDAPGLSTRTGFLVGAYMDIPLNSSLFFQPGFGLTQKGAEISANQQTVGLHIDYLEIPLLLKYAFPTSGAVGVHLMAGPVLALELSCDTEVAGRSADVACDAGEEQAFEIDTKSTDFGVMLGGGVSFPMGGVRLTAEAFYNIGMSNILDDAGVEDSAKNRALYLTAGVAFPIG